MYSRLRSFAESILGFEWARWSRVVGVAICGFWLVLPEVARAQEWPTPTWAHCFVVGAVGSTCSSGNYASHALAQAAVASDCAANHGGVVWQDWYVDVVDPPHSRNDCNHSQGSYSNFQSYQVQSTPTCSGGWGYAGPFPGQCLNATCTADGGKQVPFDVKIAGVSVCGTAPATVCLSTMCQGKVVTADCMAFTMADGSPGGAYWSGMAQSVTSGPCQTGAPAATSRIAPSTTTGASGGGVGVVTGTGTVSADSVNIARTATNTSRIAESLSAGGGGGGSCGGAGQPACAINEGDTAAQGAAAQSLQDGDKSTMGAVIDGQIAGMTLGGMPTFDQGGSKWTLSFLPFLTASGPLECEIHWTQNLAGVALTPGYNFCGFSDYVKSILYWVFAVGTVLGIWNMVYGKET